MPIEMKALPSLTALQQAFEYDPIKGVLSWRAGQKLGGMEAGSISSAGYRNVGFRGVSYQAHRLIWKLVTGSDPVAQLDHADGDPGNNRWSNLRPATHMENCRNRVRSPSATGLPTGVTRIIKAGVFGGRYRAQIRAGGPRLSLGTFATPEEAHAAYIKAGLSLHGPFSAAARGRA